MDMIKLLVNHIINTGIKKNTTILLNQKDLEVQQLIHLIILYHRLNQII